MRIEHHYPLKNHHTFHVAAFARWFIEYENEEELCRILKDNRFQKCRLLPVGEGSNLLIINDFDGVMLHSQIRGMEAIDETPETVLLSVGAAEHWDDVVAYSVAKGWGGIENLSLIPGETGAAAIQNIGAYGAEIKDVIETVEVINLITFEKRIFTNEACRYRYRHSYFKEDNHDPYIITRVNLRLQKQPHFKLDYGNLRETLNDNEITLQSIREAVINIRQNKLPDPAILGNAGSFFMNPIIPLMQFESLKSLFPDIPSFQATDGKIKISAGWLIEQCGLKGFRDGNVGVYQKQALIIVNHDNATGEEIARFAEKIRQTVYQKFGIWLVPEVKIIES